MDSSQSFSDDQANILEDLEFTNQLNADLSRTPQHSQKENGQSAQQSSQQDLIFQQSKSLLEGEDDKENQKENSTLNDVLQISSTKKLSQSKLNIVKSISNIGSINPAIASFFGKKEPDLSSITSFWKRIDQYQITQQDETKQKFIELCTFPKAFFAFKKFHLKIAQSDLIFGQSFNEKETQENDKHSQVIHKACQDGAQEQQITLLVNSHLQKLEMIENEFKVKFEEQELVFLNEYDEIIDLLYEQRLEFLHLKLQDISESAQQTNVYEEYLSEIQSFDTQNPQQNISQQITSGIQNLIGGNKNNAEGNKHKIQLCLGLQKKRIFQIQISHTSIQSIFSSINHLKKVSFENSPYSNFIYGDNGKNALFNIMTSVTKFNHHYKRYFKFRTDIHYPSFYQQYQDAISKKTSQDDGDVVVTRHSCYGKAHFMFTVTRKEDNKKLDFSFLKQLFKISNELQIKKIIIPIQLIIMQSKDIKTNTEILKEFCSTLKRELQILSYDYSYSQQFLKKIQIILPVENSRMKEMYEKIKEVLLSVLE